MPPPKEKKTVKPEELEKLREWIKDDAPYAAHGAFTEGSVAWTTISARLKQEGLEMSPSAAREKLIRRVSLDLTGLPPSPDEVDAFVKDHSPQAYCAAVE